MGACRTTAENLGGTAWPFFSKCAWHFCPAALHGILCFYFEPTGGKSDHGLRKDSSCSERTPSFVHFRQAAQERPRLRETGGRHNEVVRHRFAPASRPRCIAPS